MSTEYDVRLIITSHKSDPDLVFQVKFEESNLDVRLSHVQIVTHCKRQKNHEGGVRSNRRVRGKGVIMQIRIIQETIHHPPGLVPFDRVGKGPLKSIHKHRGGQSPFCRSRNPFLHPLPPTALQNPAATWPVMNFVEQGSQNSK